MMMPVTASDFGSISVPGAGTTCALRRRAAHELAVVVQVQGHHRDLQQRVAVPVEAAGLDVDDDGQEAAETRGE